MKATVIGPHPFARLLLLANGLFWLVFAVNFVANSFAYKPHVKIFEEVSPPYIFGSRAFPFEQYMSPMMRATRIVQWPSFYAATPLNLYFSHRGIVVDQLFWGVSVGGYYLLLVFLLSFLQWYLTGLLIDFLSRRLRTSRNRTSRNPGHAYNARR
jgi:hypothetical protein